MFSCKHCRTAIFYDFKNRHWQSVKVSPCITADGQHQPQQSAEFYVYKHGYEVIFETDDLMLVRNGEMRMKAQTGEFFHYSDQLINFGITNDDELGKVWRTNFLEIINNPWFEILDKRGQDDDFGEIYDSLDSGLATMLDIQARLDKAVLENSLKLTIDEALDEIHKAKHSLNL